jgi:hypothetical protein
MSRITVGSLEDLGYKVNYNGAELYGVEDINPSCLCKNRRLGEPWAQLPVASRSVAHASAMQNATKAGWRHLIENQHFAASHDQVSETMKYVGGDIVGVVYRDPHTGTAISVVVRGNDKTVPMTASTP